MDNTHIKYFANTFSEICFLNHEVLSNYSHDETEDLAYLPEVVLKPFTVQQVSQILVYCNQHQIPVTPVGARTGLSGGALPVCGGVALSVEKMNKILNIDEKNLQATVEAGVINQVFQDEVKQKGLFYPPDPSSWGSSFLGGNASTNAGGPKAVKYGVTKDYILNLQVVLPTGEIIWTGANVLKNSTGYNLTQLFIGSEGTLGVITKLVVKLIPLPKLNKLMLVPFFDAQKACEAVSAVFRASITPSALEFMERDAITWTLKFIDEINFDIKDNINAHLLVEVDGNNEDVLLEECEKIMQVMEAHNCDEILFAETDAQKTSLWKLRRKVAEAVKSNSIYKEEDTVVPRYEMPKLLNGVKEIGKKYGFQSVCYGHVGDGNLHVNIIKGHLTDKVWKNDLPKAIREIFVLCKNLGGTISGEHGIGLVQKQYIDVVFGKVEIDLQKRIKQVFDPNNIMNPKKIWPD